LFTKAELPPSTRIGPGFVISHSVGLIAVGHAGRQLTMRAWSAFGVRGRSEAGAGPGMPLIGDGVVLSPRSAIHGGLRCASGVRVPHHKVVVTGRRLASLAAEVDANRQPPEEAACRPT
jgi:serine acetyltransferase